MVVKKLFKIIKKLPKTKAYQKMTKKTFRYPKATHPS